ncbi:MAG: rRNA maturation RNase YbeY [Lachnospiraceae bacterium]|nr:rRNA maturation RNase YbeY [Lachnospiraceae bacterium]
MTIHTEYETGILLDIAWEQIVEDVVLAVLEYENCPYEAEVSVILTDNAAIREVNRQCRQTDAPTDVLSFPMVAYGKPGDFSALGQDEDNFNPDTGEAMLGDIVLNVEWVKAAPPFSRCAAICENELYRNV